ncbi:hypothetical protein C5C37_07090 [Rathayibacter sp. AY1F9]|jgi:hypothetical protein|nr:hypothetical protein C5C37_07090 [Rathayibacter sp. AY1F9]
MNMAESNEFGEVILWMITNSSTWQHRRVESLRLSDGPLSRRRVSLDITVPKDDRLQVTSRAPGADPLLFVPLAMVQKARLQDFDSFVDGSKPLPIADTEVNGRAAVAAVVAAWTLELGEAPSHDARVIIRTVVHSKNDSDSDKRLSDFLDGGVWEGTRIRIDAARAPQTVELLALLARNFLLAGLFPLPAAGTRQIVKYSTHWELVGGARDQRLPWWQWVTSAFGLSSASLEIPLNAGSIVAESTHLEVHTPRGLLGDEVTLESLGVVVERDMRPGVVCHVATRKDDKTPSPDRAVIRLRTSPYGLLPWTAVAATASAVMLWGGWFAGFSSRIFEPDAPSITPIFLAAIAVLLGFLSRDQENPVAARLLRPLRISVASLALVYVVLAAAIALRMGAGIGNSVWFAGGIWTAVLCALTVTGLIQCRRLAVNSDDEVLHAAGPE